MNNMTSIDFCIFSIYYIPEKKHFYGPVTINPRSFHPGPWSMGWIGPGG